MDFLKSCDTGVQTLSGYSTIQYHVYAVDRRSDTHAAGEEDVPIQDVLLSLATQLRAQKCLVYADEARYALWRFRVPGKNANGAESAFNDDPLEDGFGGSGKNFSLKSLFHGILNASDLLQCFSRPPPPSNTISPSTPTTASPSTPTAALRAAQLANLRAFQQNATTPGTLQEPTAFPLMTDVRTIHSIFMKAVIATVEYQLARHCAVVRLDGRTFVEIEKGGEDGGSMKPFTLDIYLTTAGSLVFSTAPDKRHHLRALDRHNPTALHHGENLGVYLAVAGLSALLWEESSTSDDAESLAWKDLVIERLEFMGIHLAELDPLQRWVLVRAYPESEQQDTSGDAMSFSGITFYWPAALCFFDDRNPAEDPCDSWPSRYITNGNASSLNGLNPTKPSSWFSPPDQSGFTDPLHFAEEWYRAKPSRDAVIEERRRRAKEAEDARKQAESVALNVASPFYTRGDLQAVGGVYPTPPDGVPPNVTSTPLAPTDVPQTYVPTTSVASMSDPATAPASGSARPSIDYNTGDAMDLDMSAFGEGVKLRGPSIVSRGSLTLESGADLFGELDEDEFVGNDITDADFSFFDGPDPLEEQEESGGRMDGVDASAVVDETEPAADIKEENPEVQPVDSTQTDLQTLAEVNIKEEDFALPTATQNTEVVPDTPNAQSSPQLEVAKIKSPLSPTSVRMKLFEFTIDEEQSPALLRKRSTFEPVPFNTDLTKQDAKYSSDGAFAFSPPPSTLKRSPPKLSSATLPPRKKRTRNQPTYPGSQLALVKVRDWDSDGSVTSDASDDDSFAEFGGLSIGASPTKGSYAGRFWDAEDGDTSVATSPGNYMSLDDGTYGSGEGMGGSRKDRIALLSTILRPQTEHHSMPLLMPPKPEPEGLLMLNPTLSSPGMSMISMPGTPQFDSALQPAHKDFISVAQIVAEQVIFGAIDIPTSTRSVTADLSRLSLGTDSTNAVNGAQRALGSFLKGSTHCDLLKFICVQDAIPEKSNAKGQPNLPRKPVTTTTADGTNIPATSFTSFPVPHVRIRRNDSLWDVLPPALPFWEHLGLAPASGKKNIMAFCVYPSNNDLKEQVRLFQNYLGATYESGKLGSHSRCELGEWANGMVPWSIEGNSSSSQGIMTSLRQTCAHLGKALASVDWTRKKTSAASASGAEETSKIDDLVVYIVNPFPNMTSIPHLCSAFWTLYETYRQTKARSPTNINHQSSASPDIVLQILPMSSIASPSSPVIPTHTFFQKLARQVYDRCPPATITKEAGAWGIDSAAAVRLETPLLKHVQFKLNVGLSGEGGNGAGADLMRDPGFLNVAYAISAGGEWCTAAWTDGVGRYQATVSYCLVGRSFFEVIREIWQSCLGIMEGRGRVWRVCVAKVGSMGREEFDAWTQLNSTPTTMTMLTILASIETNPSLCIFPKPMPGGSSSLHNNNNNQLSGLNAATPSSTPAPIVSPENTTHALTPAATPAASATDPAIDIANDPDARLVDVGDEVVGVILGHKTNVSGRADEYRPSLSSGYLVRRGGTAGTWPLDDDEDEGSGGAKEDVDCMGVHLLWIAQNNSRGNAAAAAAASSSSFAPPSASAPAGPVSTPTSAITPTSSLPSSSSTDPALLSSSTIPTPTTPHSQSQPQTQSGGGGSPLGVVGGINLPKHSTDSLLRDYLGMFRNLGVLARARGLRGTRAGLVPWHVRVCERGVGGLEGGYGRVG